jgi:hypothetical protein
VELEEETQRLFAAAPAVGQVAATAAHPEPAAGFRLTPFVPPRARRPPRRAPRGKRRERNAPLLSLLAE